ncbi:MAG TPA: hypothetical protein VGR57_00740 [Ktedonobacterales bacterium]|nr:hypothetical protein [Ktedonobacterales bacterium]
MKSLRDVDWRVLEWAKVAGWTWELRASEELVARLRLTDPVTLTEAAAAEAAEGQWLLTLTGLMVRKLTVREAAAPSDPPIMKAYRSLRHSWTFPRADGQALRWQAPGLTSRDWICTDQDGKHLITVSLRSAVGEVAATGRVLLQEAAREVPGLSLAIVIGWYLLVVYRLDASQFREG